MSQSIQIFHAFSELFTIFLKYWNWKETTKVYEKMPRHFYKPLNFLMYPALFSH